jgi:hypothetical protein
MMVEMVVSKVGGLARDAVTVGEGRRVKRWMKSKMDMLEVYDVEGGSRR